MNLKFIIGGDTKHYVEFFLNQNDDTIIGRYAKGGVIEMEHKVVVNDVLSVEPTINPRFELSKKGRIWDFHCFKNDIYGKEYRRSVAVFTAEDVSADQVELYNDTSKTVTLKNYAVHPLDVYNSTLAVGHFEFRTVDGIEGQSSTQDGKPKLGNDSLMMGFGGDITLNLFGEGVLDETQIPFVMIIKVDALAKNDSSGQHQLGFQLGDNMFKIDTTKGIILSRPDTADKTLFTKDKIPTDPFTIRLFVSKTEAKLFLNHTPVSIPDYNRSTRVDYLKMYSFCNNGAYSIIDLVQFHALTNFKLDTVPPKSVRGLVATAGDKKISLQWLPNVENDLQGYRVYVNGKQHNISPITLNMYDVNALINTQSVRISVTAVDKAGNESVTSSVIEIAPIQDTKKEVTNFTSQLTEIGVHFDWIPPVYPDIEGIKVYRLNKVDGTRIELKSLPGGLPATAKGYSDEPKPEPGLYTYIVTTYDKAGNESAGVQKVVEVL